MLYTLLWMTIIAGAYMAWNIGANDVANAMGTSVGSEAITFKQAIIIAGTFEFCGAMLVGSHVTETVRKGIVDPAVFAGAPEDFAIGMFAALMGAAIWLNLASFFGLPVSTTHSIVGAISGFGIVFGGFGAIKWSGIAKIALAWIVSPLAGGLIAFIAFKIIQHRILGSKTPGYSAYRLAPFFTFAVGFILTLSVIYKGLNLNLPPQQAILYATLAGSILGMAYHFILRQVWNSYKEGTTAQEMVFVENIFRYLQVATACYMAFAHGANDVANAVGPIAAVYEVYKTNIITTKVAVPIWILAIGGVGIVIGLSTWGYRVIKTIGTKITEMTPTRGFSAEFGAATTVLICSKLGLPISTTQVLVGAVIGVGLARGMGSLDLIVIRKVVSSWAFEIPLTALISVIIYLIVSNIL